MHCSKYLVPLETYSGVLSFSISALVNSLKNKMDNVLYYLTHRWLVFIMGMVIPWDDRKYTN